jgi:hypothetical protein
MSRCKGLHCDGCGGHGGRELGAVVALLALIGLAALREAPKFVHVLEIIGLHRRRYQRSGDHGNARVLHDPRDRTASSPTRHGPRATPPGRARRGPHRLAERRPPCRCARY